MAIIASWNINSVRIRIHLLTDFINEIKPDVILLQEIKCLNEDFPDFYSSLNYKAIINGQKGKYGVAILLKKELKYKEINLNHEIFNKESRTNFIYIQELDLNILNVYTPNGNPMENEEKFKFKISWLNEIKKISSNFINNMQNLLIAGDFNVLEDEKDVINFKNWQQDALGCMDTRKKFREILSSGLTNIVRLFKKPGSTFSYWDYQRACWERNDGLLIDHFLVSPRYLKFVKNIYFGLKYRGLEKPSDHIPIWINLNI